MFFVTSMIAHYSFFFFFNDTATTEIYTLSLHDALPILPPRARVFGEHGTGDRLHQVRLAESCGAVDEERIVGLAGCLSDRVRGRRGELVRQIGRAHV